MSTVGYQAIALRPIHAYDLAELGRYCCAYAQLMQHWRTVLPEDAILKCNMRNLSAIWSIRRDASLPIVGSNGTMPA